MFFFVQALSVLKSIHADQSVELQVLPRFPIFVGLHSDPSYLSGCQLSVLISVIFFRIGKNTDLIEFGCVESALEYML